MYVWKVEIWQGNLSSSTCYPCTRPTSFTFKIKANRTGFTWWNLIICSGSCLFIRTYELSTPTGNTGKLKLKWAMCTQVEQPLKCLCPWWSAVQVQVQVRYGSVKQTTLQSDRKKQINQRRLADWQIRACSYSLSFWVEVWWYVCYKFWLVIRHGMARILIAAPPKRGRELGEKSISCRRLPLLECVCNEEPHKGNRTRVPGEFKALPSSRLSTLQKQ